MPISNRFGSILYVFEACFGWLIQLKMSLFQENHLLRDAVQLQLKIVKIYSLSFLCYTKEMERTLPTKPVT